MLTPKHRKQLHAILDANKKSQRAIRASTAHARAAVRTLEEAYHALSQTTTALEKAFTCLGRTAHVLGDSFQTQEEAMDGAIAANQAALDLLNELSS